MSMDTIHGARTALNKDRRTVPQLLAAAAKDTDAASVFYNGTGPADYDSAILVIKGRENVDYVVSMLARQNLVTPGKPVEAAPDPCSVSETDSPEKAAERQMWKRHGDNCDREI